MERWDTMMSAACKVPSPDDAQFKLFGDVPVIVDAPLLQTAVNSGRRFVTGDAHHFSGGDATGRLFEAVWPACSFYRSTFA